METLPIEIQWNIMKYLTHPTADLIKRSDSFIARGDWWDFYDERYNDYDNDYEVEFMMEAEECMKHYHHIRNLTIDNSDDDSSELSSDDERIIPIKQKQHPVFWGIKVP